MKSRIAALALMLAAPFAASASCTYNPETGFIACTFLPSGCSVDQAAHIIYCIDPADVPEVAGITRHCTKGGGAAACPGLAPASCRITLTYDANAPATVRREDAARCDQAADEVALILFLKRSIAGETAQ
jgi:hypothetical protein